MSGFLEIVHNPGDVFPETKTNDIVIWATDSNQTIRLGVGSNQGMALTHDTLTTYNLQTNNLNGIFKGLAHDGPGNPSFTWCNNTNMGMFRLDSNIFGMSTDSTPRMYVTDAGVGVFTSNPVSELEVKGTITADAVQNLSDLRLKYNIQPIESRDALDKVNRLRACRYTFKHDIADRPRCGLLAQELRDIIPESVWGDEDSGPLTVSYNDVLAIVIEACKELSTRVTALERRLS